MFSFNDGGIKEPEEEEKKEEKKMANPFSNKIEGTAIFNSSALRDLNQNLTP